MYNYYSSTAPTSCTVPGTTGANDGNVQSYFYQDNAATPAPDTSNTASYTYDSLSRLSTSIATGSQTHNLTFAYDRYGNMTCVTNASTNGPCGNRTFNAANNRITNTSFTYDAAGNLTADGTGFGTHTYQWDAENRLKSVDGGATVSYTYNSLGQRVEKKVGTAYSEYTFGAYGELLAVHDRTGWRPVFVPFGGRTLAVYNSGTHFVHGNHVGSSSMVTDYTGAMEQKTLYYPWGQAWVSAGTIKDNRFASLGQRDAETTTWQDPLDPTLFRLYTSGLGRWLSPDPLAGSIFNPQSLNRYAYVLNNPCSLTDPLGLDPCSYNISLLPGRNSPLNNSNFATGIENEIKRIFGLADLGVNFNSDSPDYTLVVANLVPSGTRIDANAIGFTNVDPSTGSLTGRGTVYESRLEQFDPATAHNTGFLAIGLGRAGAHEVGHFLLELKGHESSGLMQAGFNGSAWHLPDTTGQFAFTPEQSDSLQKDCKNRRSQPGNGQPAGNRGSGGPPSGFWVPRGPVPYPFGSVVDSVCLTLFGHPCNPVVE